MSSRMIDDNQYQALKVFLAAFSISSVGGLAALLRSKQQISMRKAISATLYSGMIGLTIALLWYNYFDGQDHLYFLLGVSCLAGVGGTTVLDFIIQMLKYGGINISISAKDED